MLYTGDCGANGLPDESIDYVFTDPPFGENIFYADLNHLVESWHRTRTRPGTEAIVDRPKGKDVADLGLIRFGGHLPRGEYDVDHDGYAGQADAAELHG